MVGGVNEDATRDEPVGYAPDEPAVVRDVMDGERAHDEVEATGPERGLLDRLAHVRQARMAPLGPGQLEHPLGEVDADHLGGTTLGAMVRGVAYAAPEAEHAASRDVGKERHDARVLERLRP